MPLRVREVFPTVQGEGSQAGLPAVFVRMSGCNLWSGIQHLRSKGSGDCASWCDTDFASGDPWHPVSLADRVVDLCAGWSRPAAVITGGEPLLQLRRSEGVEFLHRLRDRGVFVAVETNGTQRIPAEVLALLGHVTVSPKGLVGRGGDSDHIVQRVGTDFKVVVPCPFEVGTLQELAQGFDHQFVQPKDEDGDPLHNRQVAIDLARRLGWRVSFQMHKLAGLP